MNKNSEKHTAQTTYTIHNDDGTAMMETDSANVAEAHSRIGLQVTAETTASRW